MMTSMRHAFSAAVERRDYVPFAHRWEHEVREVCRTSNDPGLVRNALRLFPTPDDTVVLLSNREKKWLNTCLQAICKAQAINVPLCDSITSVARKIVEITTRRPKPSPFNADWLIEALRTRDIADADIVHQLDDQLFLWISRTIMPEWVACCLGHPNDFFVPIIKLRNELVYHVQIHGTAKLASLQAALPTQQPVLSWLLSTAMSCDTSSNPTESLQFIIQPVQQILAERRPDFPERIQRLLIIEKRFISKIATTTDVNWSAPFPIDFWFWKTIKMVPPSTKAVLDTETVKSEFQQFASDEGMERRLGRNWSAYSNNILECLRADAGVLDYVKELVELFLDSNPRNIYLATAIGSALNDWKFKPREPWAPWDIINPDDSFAGCLNLIVAGNCYPYLPRIPEDVRRYVALRASNEQLIPYLCSTDPELRKQRDLLLEKASTTKSEHFEMGEQQKIGGNTKSVHFEMGEQQKIGGNTKSVHFEMGEQQNIIRPFLGRPVVEDKVPKRTYNRDLRDAELAPSSEQQHSTILPPLKTLGLPRDLLLAEPNPDSRNSTNLWHHEHRPADILHSDYILPRIPFPSSEQAEVWQAQTWRTEPSQGLGIELKPRDASPPTPEIHSQASSSSTITQRNSDDARLLVNQRAKNACSRCRKRKIKCDENRPSCRGCWDRHRECTYLPIITRVSSSLPVQMADGMLNNNCPEHSSQNLERTDSTTTLPPDEHWTIKTSEDNPVELQATPGPIPDEDPFGMHTDSIAPSTWDQLNAVDWEVTSMRPDLTAVARTTLDVLHRHDMLKPESPATSEHSLKQDLRALREGSSSEVCFQEATEGERRALNLTDEQCRKIQDLVDPDGTRINKSWEIAFQPQLIRYYMAGMSFETIASKMALGWSHKTYSNRLCGWNLPVDRTDREKTIGELYLALDPTREPDLLAHTPSIPQEQSDFLRYSSHDLGKTLLQTRIGFRGLFGTPVFDETTHFPHLPAATVEGRRLIACRAKSRLIDVAPHRARKYHWVEKYHKKEISEANSGGAILSSVEQECLRPFGDEALDYLWFLHFDLGISAAAVLETFRPQYSKETVKRAHFADFKRRGFAIDYGFTDGLSMKTGRHVMRDAFEKSYRLCDIRLDAVQYKWIPEIFKDGMRDPSCRHKAFVEYCELSEIVKTRRMTGHHCGPLKFPGLEDMPKSTFHKPWSREQLPQHVTSLKPSQKICTRSCAGCVSSKSGGEKCAGLQSGKKGMVEELSATPLDISTDVQQINPEDATSEYQSPANFHPSPSTKQSSLGCEEHRGFHIARPLPAKGEVESLPTPNTITLTWDASNKRRIRQPFNPVKRRKVAENRGNACDKHRASRTICDPEQCRQNKIHGKRVNSSLPPQQEEQALNSEEIPVFNGLIQASEATTLPQPIAQEESTNLKSRH